MLKPESCAGFGQEGWRQEGFAKGGHQDPSPPVKARQGDNTLSEAWRGDPSKPPPVTCPEWCRAGWTERPLTRPTPVASPSQLSGHSCSDGAGNLRFDSAAIPLRPHVNPRSPDTLCSFLPPSLGQRCSLTGRPFPAQNAPLRPSRAVRAPS